MKCETQYPAQNLEFLTLKSIVVKKFHKYLYGSTLDIYTDNNPMTHILTTTKLDTMSHHWEASLANYNFQLYYRVGKANIAADTLLSVLACLCTQHLGHTPLSHCSGSVSHAQGHTWGPHESHWGIQLWPVCLGPGREWSPSHLYDHQRLATGQAGRPHPGSGDSKNAGWDLRPLPIQADWPTWAAAAPSRMQPPQAEVGCRVQKSFAERVPWGSWYC